MQIQFQNQKRPDKQLLALPFALALLISLAGPTFAGDDDHVFGRPGSMNRTPYTPGDPYTDWGGDSVRGFAGYPMTGNGSYPTYKSDAGSTTSLRNPYIDGTMVTEPNTSPPSSQLPALGDGPMPIGTNPGDWGAPFLPPTQMQFPIMDASQSKDYAKSLNVPPGAPLLTSPDPGPVYPKMGGPMPPVEVTNIQPSGGLIGQPPIKRWQGQTTRDLGVLRTRGSKNYDFGMDLDDVAVMKPSASQDGVRPFVDAQQASMDAVSNRDPNLPGATTTQNLYGNRQKWNKRNPPLRPLTTLVKY